MFTQFRSQYPTGGLVSELLQVHEGHYLVRTLVQVSGVTLASGMAAAPTLELAEDQARIRALALLDIHPPASSTSPLQNGSRHLEAAVPQPIEPAVVETPETTPLEPQSPPIQPIVQPVETSIPDVPVPEVTSTWEASESPLEEESSSWMPEDLSPLPEVDTAYSPPNLPEPSASAEEAVDFTEISIQINLELKHIGWTQKQENSYLKRIYGKNGRALLSDRELLEFLHYLQAYAQTTVELERLHWSNEQGSEYLEETYAKKSRALLNCDELQGFLSYLQTQPTPNEALF
ncbi:hypothetical protein QPK87_04450 [Kamptonema cortianum]|nr:hypothetical protein [Geitlerinema splendidum]MDK3155827.1 hypothetical protein [Kamptonema cortianum]